MKTKLPKVSVIVPNYNHGRYLKRRLQSILDQTYQDFELVYLDDASMDDSAEVFAPFAADPRVRTVLNHTNSGSPFKQWNKGVREAHGEYIWIAEADDWAEPRLLETLVNRLEAHPNVGVAYCQSLIVDENDCVQWNAVNSVRHLDPARWTEDFVNDGRDECRRALIYQCTIPNASAALFRKDVYVRAGYANETLRLAGDWMLWVKMLLLSDVAFVAEPLNAFRKHAGSVTHRTTLDGTALLERCLVLSRIVDQIEVAPETLRRVCDAVVAEWVAMLPPQSSRLPWTRHQEIYRAAHALDRGLNTRLTKLLTRTALRTLLRDRPRQVYNRFKSTAPLS
jgi:hypothetical protein